jgi:general secretion pathway protein E
MADTSPHLPALADGPVQRRREARLPGTDTWVRLAISGRSVDSEVRDVSTHGLGLVVTDQPGIRDALQIGRHLPLSIAGPDGQRTGVARIAWVRSVGNRVEVGLHLQPGARADAEASPIDLEQLVIDVSLGLRCPASLLRTRQLLPLCSVAGHVYVARGSSVDAVGVQAIERHLGMPAVLIAATPASLRATLDRVLGAIGSASGLRRALDPEAGVVVTLVDELLTTAVLRGASDIHLDPEPDCLRVRLRVHGELEDLRDIAPDSAGEVVSRIKVLAGMDIAERRAPQDGRFTIPGPPAVDVRAAALPARRGEKLTLRLFVQSVSRMNLNGLGFGDDDRIRFHAAIQRPHGLILITGPTGSGKSTTLYAALRQLQASEPLNLLTVEDPVEYEVPGVTQMDISQGGERLTFANALRASLRHDPDVIMLGEIRDRETAELAIRAALTGHLVLSTLHTNSAVGAVTRLVDLGIQPFLIGATLRLVVAQRLVRRLCPVTWTERRLTVAEAATLGRAELAGCPVREPQGSIYNANRGFIGRVGVFECFPVDEILGRAIADGADETRLGEMLRERQVPTLVDDAVAKLRNGITTYGEVVKAVSTW